MRELKRDVSALQKELTKTSMRDNYTDYVKIERNIQNLQMKIQESNNSDVVKNFLIKYGINYGTQAVLSLILVVITLCYRKHAVIVFSDKYNFSPFSKIISFPSIIPNSVSVPFWIFCNNYAFRHIGSYLNK